MRWEIKEPGWQQDWHDTFIWWPRKIQGHWVWLETAQRILHVNSYEGPSYSWYQYRLLDQPPEDWNGV